MGKRASRQFYSRLILCFFLFFSSIAAAGEPLDQMRAAVDRALRILSDPQLRPKEKKSERIQRLKEIVNPLFDYEEMAKRTLGAHWQRRTPAEQEEFVRVFREFIERIYSDKIDLYNGEKVLFTREHLDGDYAQVDSSIVNQKNEEFPVAYRLRRANGHWKVYDVVVENISIVNNYRSQFNRVISNGSFAELIRRIKAKGR